MKVQNIFVRKQKGFFIIGFKRSNMEVG